MSVPVCLAIVVGCWLAVGVPTAVNMVKCEQCGANVGLFVAARKAKVLQCVYLTIKGP